KRGALIASGILLGFAFLFLQKTNLTMALVGELLVEQAVCERSPRALFLYAAAWAAPVLPYFAYLYFRGALVEYWLQCWLVNLNWIETPQRPWAVVERLVRHNTAVVTLFLVGLPFLRSAGLARIGFL